MTVTPRPARLAPAFFVMTALAACTFSPVPAGEAAPGAVATSPAVRITPAAPVPAGTSRAATVTTTPAPQGVTVIKDNRGGNVVQMMAYRSQLAASGQRVEIRGICNSACTMLTTLPNACLAPDASIGFHAPRIPNTQVIPPIVDQLMATTYRNGIRARWYNEWRHSLKIQSISAQEYVRLDPMTKLCAS